MTRSKIIQQLIAEVLEASQKFDTMTTEQAKDEMVQIGARALIALKIAPN